MSVARQVLLALLTGLLTTVGGLVAPSLFATLDDRVLAGRIAGQLFHETNLLAMVLVFAVLLCGGGTRLTRVGLALVLMPAVLLAANEWGLHPLIAAEKLAHGSQTTAFALWHGLSSASFGLATLAAWAAFIRELRAR